MSSYPYASNYGGFNSANAEALAAFLVMVSIFVIVILVFALAIYLFNSYSIYRIAKRQGVKNPWLAWIPYASSYILGETAGPMKMLGKWEIKSPGVFLLVTDIIFVSIASVAGFFLGITNSGMIMALSNTESIALGIFLYILYFIELCGIVVIGMVYSLILSTILFRIHSRYLPYHVSGACALFSVFATLCMPILLIWVSKKPQISEGCDFVWPFRKKNGI